MARNLRLPNGEIDLLVDFAGERAAVEVKSGTGEPAYEFTDDKARRVGDLAAGLDPPVFRVDLVTVLFRAEDIVIRWVPDAC